VAGRAQSLIEWAQQPAAHLNSTSDVAAVRRQLQERRLAAANCLRELNAILGFFTFALTLWASVGKFGFGKYPAET
jgi:hypothetical protein